MPPPDGDIAAVAAAAPALPRWGWAATLLIVMLSCPIGSVTACLGAAWVLSQATRSPLPRWGMGRLSRLLLALATVASIGAPILSSPSLGAAAAVMWGLCLLSLLTFLHNLTRPGTALRQQLRRVSGGMLAMTGTALGLVSVLLLAIPSPQQSETGGLALIGVAALLLLLSAGLFPRLSSLMQQFWPLKGTPPAVLLDDIEAALVRICPLQFTTEGRRLVGVKTEGDWSVEMTVDLWRAPMCATITITLPTLPPDLFMRARQADEPPGVPLPDALLSRLILVEGCSAAQAKVLLEGLHGEVLAVLHPWPGATVHSGVLHIPMLGPHFVPEGQAELPPPQALAMRLGEALGLARALSERAALLPAAASHAEQPTRQRLPPLLKQ